MKIISGTPDSWKAATSKRVAHSQLTVKTYTACGICGELKEGMRHKLFVAKGEYHANGVLCCTACFMAS